MESIAPPPPLDLVFFCQSFLCSLSVFLKTHVETIQIIRCFFEKCYFFFFFYLTIWVPSLAQVQISLLVDVITLDPGVRVVLR